MKAVALTGNFKIEMIDIETPQPDGHNVIVEVSKCGICGGDFHYMFEHGGEPPFGNSVIGHEFSGRVIDPGCRSDLKAGQRIVAAPNLGCGKCELCQNGLSNLCGEIFFDVHGYQPITAVPPQLVLPIPDDITDTQAAMLEPIATPISAVRRVGINVGDKVLVIGSGIIGCAAMVVARQAGASSVVLSETNTVRAKECLDRGECDMYFDAKEPDIIANLREASGGKGFDVVIECSGAEPAYTVALSTIKAGKNIILIGGAGKECKMPIVNAVFGANSLIASYAYKRDDFEVGIELVRKGIMPVDAYGTKKISLEEVPETFLLLHDNKINDYKVIIDMQPQYK